MTRLFFALRLRTEWTWSYERLSCFVRGRVHHDVADAIEFRADVPLEMGPNVAAEIVDDAPLIARRAWADATKLGTGRRDPKEAAYTKLLAGREVRAALIDVADVAAKLYTDLSTGN